MGGGVERCRYFNSHGSKKKISLEEARLAQTTGPESRTCLRVLKAVDVLQDLDESKRKEKFDCNLKTASTVNAASPARGIGV